MNVCCGVVLRPEVVGAAGDTSGGISSRTSGSGNSDSSGCGNSAISGDVSSSTSGCGNSGTSCCGYTGTSGCGYTGTSGDGYSVAPGGESWAKAAARLLASNGEQRSELPGPSSSGSDTSHSTCSFCANRAAHTPCS